MADNSCIKIQGGNVRGKTLELGNHEQHDLISGGTFLHNCVLDIRGAEFSLVDTNLLNCRINVQQCISNMRFPETVFENCIFEGEFVDCSFGFRRGESKSPNAYYRKCDFTRANLHLCRFFGGDVDTVLWPPWPNIALLNPRQNKQDWLSIPFPDELNELKSVVTDEALSANADEQGKERANVVDNAPLAITVDLARYKATDPEFIWTLIQNKTYIAFDGNDQKT
jgi:hypothetical protein